MLTFLKKLQFSQLLVMASALPMCLVLVISTAFLLELSQEKKRINYSIDAVLLTKMLEEVAHQHAVERGITAGFLGSQGERNKAKMLQQREKSDAAVSALLALKQTDLKEFDINYINETTARLHSALNTKAELRKKVDALSPNEAFTFYSNVNKEALDAIQIIDSHIHDGQTLHHLNDLITIFWVKEYAGQVRGKINGAFAAQKVSPENYAFIVEALRLEKQSYDNFFLFSDKQEIDVAQKYTDRDTWNTVEKITTAFIINGLSGTTIDPTNGSWFELATARINNIKEISQHLEEILDEEVSVKIKAVNHKIVSLITAVALVSIALISLNIFVYQRLKNHVLSIEDIFQKVTTDSNLSLRLNKKGNDEFVKISNSIDHHLNDMCEIIRKFEHASQRVSETTHSIENGLSHCKENSTIQNDQSSQIAVAVNQLAASSTTIAEKMSAINHAMNSASEHSQSSRKESAVVRDFFTKLSSETSLNQEHIEALAEHSQEISSIIETISGIAEQTNLLALNAAIEAARAGEQGRGFAVVADEVRSLAQKTQESTASIKQMIERLEGSSQTALQSMQANQKLVHETSERIETSDSAALRSSEEINQINTLIEEVSATTEEQTTVIKDINENINELKELTQKTFSEITSASEKSGGLSQDVKNLDEKIQRFSCDGPECSIL